VLTSALWGLIQGLTEFLPISSSGHLILVPALVGLDEPSLAAATVLHLGTLLAIGAYYRSDLRRLVVEPLHPESRRLWTLLAVGTVPAAIVGFTLGDPIEIIFEEPWIVAVMLVVTGLVLALGLALPSGERTLDDAGWRDAAIVGVSQAFALIPGISRAGMTITAGMAQGMTRVDAARYAFLLGLPAIGGSGLINLYRLAGTGTFEAHLLVGVVTSAITGWFAISFLVRLLRARTMAPFAIYCVVGGIVSYLLV
jgi:undecaprenyl-diphosphatase